MKKGLPFLHQPDLRARRVSYNGETPQPAHRGREAAALLPAAKPAYRKGGEPGITAGLDKLINAGAAEIVVLPYLLAAGQHVASDIPAEVESLARRHPRVRIILAPHLGAAGGMPELICAHLRRV